MAMNALDAERSGLGRCTTATLAVLAVLIGLALGVMGAAGCGDDGDDDDDDDDDDVSGVDAASAIDASVGEDDAAVTPDAAAGGSCGGFLAVECPDDQFCDYARDATCGVADAPGTCAPRPINCKEIFDPVCGCNGTTYENECLANYAGVDILAEGECPV